MDIRRLLHPLPLFLVFLFVAVAVGDLVQKLTEEPPPPPELVGFAIPRFEALEPVIDFRPDLGDLPVEIRPVPELTQGQWSDPRRSGVWARGPAAEFMIDLAAGGHRVLILDCMPTSGKRSARAVHLAMNGIDCGGVALEPGWMKYRFALPAGATRAGPNRLAFSFPDPGEAKRKPRQLLVRRLGLFLEDDFDVDILDDVRPVSFDFDAGRVTIRRSGALEIPLVLEDRTDALQMRYRFSSGVGRADVEVALSQPGDTDTDDAVKTSVSADQQAAGRIRIPLHGRRGAYVLRIRADLATPDGRLLISSLRLVEEGDPTRRPGAANPPPS
jgi:hypothetical protein